jgi:cbb3-type cytochrome oxidase cytochrome c subunit
MRRKTWSSKPRPSCSASKSARWNRNPDREIIALIAYLQRLGKDIKAAPVATPTTAAN